MKAGIFYGPGDVRVEEREDPVIQKPTDAVVRVTYACICGSDLWYWRGESDKDEASPIGHEFMGIVEAVGDDVANIKAGDLVVAPFYMCDNTCQECTAGMSSACRNRQMWGSDGNDGGQGQKVRVDMADGTLFVIPKDQEVDESMMPKLLPLSDVLCTGHHAAVSAEVTEGSTVAVVGDGAVGLCAVAAAKRLGAKQIILVSTHEDRAAIGSQFGATDIVAARGDDAIKQVKELTNDLGVDSVLECVGKDESWSDAFGMVRPGGMIGFVGVPNAKDPSLGDMFAKNIGVRGGMAPAATYLPDLLPDVLSGKLNVSAIFTKTISLDELSDGYKAMDEREAIKTMIKM